jgi:hypothetical protein
VYGITNYVAVNNGISLKLTVDRITSPDVDGSGYEWEI